MLRDLLSDIQFRFRAVFRRGDVERELADELQLHVEIETDRLIAEGMSAGEARRQARLALGGVEQVKEATRDARGLAWLEAMQQDLRWAVRGLRRSPGFTAAVVLTLALGLGANAALYSVIDRVMFRPPAYLRDPARVHRVVMYELQFGRRDIPELSMPHVRYTNIERTTHSFDRIAGFLWGMAPVGAGTTVQQSVICAVTAGYFDFFEAHPLQGRFLGAGDDGGVTGAPVVVVSYSYWRDQLAARADVVGTSIVIDSALRTIVGVAPQDFTGIPDGRTPVLWIPVPSNLRSRMSMVVHRKPGVSEVAASADLSHAFLESYAAERAASPRMAPIDEARPSAAVVSLHEMLRPNAPPEAKLYPWIGAVGFIVLLIACANTANLLLARALTRRREIAVRLALGISRARLFSQLLTESLLLALVGGLGGLVAAHWGAEVLRTLLSAQNVVSSLTIPDRAAPIDAGIAVITDSRTLRFASCAVLAVGVLAGLAPAVQALRQDVNSNLKSGAREGSYERSRTRGMLLIAQVALSAVLLVGAGLFVRSLVHLRAVRVGYDIDPVLAANINLRGTRLDDSASALLMGKMLGELTTIPGVTHAARASTFSGFIAYEKLSVPGVNAAEGQFLQLIVGPEYFTTIGTRVLRGRPFTVTDRADAALVTIVSRAMAHALWPGQEALGRCIRLARFTAGAGVEADPDTAPCRTVVGIAEDIKQKSFVDDAGLQYYLPTAQYPGGTSLLVRVNGNAASIAETIRRRLHRILPQTADVTVTPLRSIIDSKMRPWQLGATLFLAFGGLALIVAAVGLFAVISYNVEQRSHELGVRIACGAESVDVLRLVVGQAARFALAGAAIGATIALWAGHWMRPLLFDEPAGDPVVYITVAATLFAVALVASAVPAFRAAGTDPNAVLRSE
jgi:putative ABC transport system permease protein